MASASRSGLLVPASYEVALQELEQLIARLESGAMPLEQLLAGYQHGAELLKFCRARLADLLNDDGRWPRLRQWNQLCDARFLRPCRVGAQPQPEPGTGRSERDF